MYRYCYDFSLVSCSFSVWWEEVRSKCWPPRGPVVYYFLLCWFSMQNASWNKIFLFLDGWASSIVDGLSAETKYAFGRCSVTTHKDTCSHQWSDFYCIWRKEVDDGTRVCLYNWQLLYCGGWRVFLGFSILTLEFNNFDTCNIFRLCSRGWRLTRNSGSCT